MLEGSGTRSFLAHMIGYEYEMHFLLEMNWEWVGWCYWIFMSEGPVISYTSQLINRWKRANPSIFAWLPTAVASAVLE